MDREPLAIGLPAAPDRTLHAVIFDCDGVMFDSWDANIRYYDAVLAALGRPPLDASGQRLAHVLSSPQLFAVLFGDDGDLMEQARIVAQTVDYGEFCRWMRPATGLYEVLAQLKPRYRLAMATNRGATLPGVVRHFELAEWLEFVVGIHDVGRPKPHPDMLVRCLEHFGLAASQAVYVGDTDSDHAAARAAGMHFIACGDVAGASLRIRTLAELAPLLAAQWPPATSVPA